jgi:pimeloyl-ACP methyl ester carboxylesterase
MGRVRVALVCLVVLCSGCARTLFGRGEPFQPWASPAVGVTAAEHDGTLVLTPIGPSRPLLFLHGFASLPAQYRFTLEHLAARGWQVFAPTLPDYFLGRIGYHRAVLDAAERAYAEVVAQTHAAVVVVVGYSTRRPPGASSLGPRPFRPRRRGAASRSPFASERGGGPSAIAQ